MYNDEPHGLDFELAEDYIPEDFLVKDILMDGARHILFSAPDQLALLVRAGHGMSTELSRSPVSHSTNSSQFMLSSRETAAISNKCPSPMPTWRNTLRRTTRRSWKHIGWEVCDGLWMGNVGCSCFYLQRHNTPRVLLPLQPGHLEEGPGLGTRCALQQQRSCARPGAPADGIAFHPRGTCPEALQGYGEADTRGPLPGFVAVLSWCMDDRQLVAQGLVCIWTGYLH